MSITPAFSPGPWITQGALVGSVRRWIFEDLYEQCSFHMAEKMPSSVKVGVAADQLADALVFVRLEAVGGDQRRRDLVGVLRRCGLGGFGGLLALRVAGFLTLPGSRLLRCPSHRPSDVIAGGATGNP